MKSARCFAYLAVTLFCSLSAFAVVQSNASFPIDLSVFVPCAAGGAGEVVSLTGNLHDMFSVTVNSNSFHMTIHDNPQGIVGVGLTTGGHYRGTGVTRLDMQGSLNGFPFTTTFTNNFRIIGESGVGSFIVHETAHVTVHANGTVTGFHDHFSFECR
jgi:hypothetical protein